MQSFPRPTFDHESNIHVLAAALDKFFRDLNKQPSDTWIEALREGMLVPFVTRPDPPKACLFGERNPRASSLLHEERPQNWLAWFMPFLTHEDGKADLLRTPSVENSKIESIWSIGLLLTTSCLHWAFANCSAEFFQGMIMDIRNKFEPLGWDDLNSARVRRILSAFIAKVNNSKTYIAKTDLQQMKFLENMAALCSSVEDFVFFSPLYGFNTKPEPGTCGLHFDGSGILDADLLKGLFDCIQTHTQAEMKTVMQGMDKKDAKEYKKRFSTLEDIKGFLQLAINWTTAASHFLSQTSERAWVAGRADGLHVGLGDRVLIKQGKQGDLLATVAYKAPGQLGVVFDGPMGGSNGTFNGKQLFVCTDGHGALIKPEHAYSQEDNAGKQECEKVAASVVEAMAKRSYFKANKKQVREAFDEVLKVDKKQLKSRLRESTTFSATLADVPFEMCLEQTKAGAYSLRRTIRYLTKIQEAKLAFLTILDKVNQEEGSKQMADQMEMFSRAQKCVVHFEFAKGLRERQVLNEIHQEVIVPFQALEKEYDTAVGHFRLQHNVTEKAIEANQTALAKELAECEKDLQELRKLKQEMDAGKKPNDAAKFTKMLQQAAAKIAQYESASLRFKEETHASLRRNQRQLRANLQTVEQRRLVFTQVYLQRYLDACETLTGAFPHLPFFHEQVADLSPPADLALFIAIHRRPDIEYFVQKTSCTAADVLQGNLAPSVFPMDPSVPSLIRGASLLDDSSRSSVREDGSTCRTPGRQRRLAVDPDTAAEYEVVGGEGLTETVVETGDDPLETSGPLSPSMRGDTQEETRPPPPPFISSPSSAKLHDFSPGSPSSPRSGQARSVMGLSSAMKGHSKNSLTAPPCPECRCVKFSPSLLKKSKCSNCNHAHSVASPKLEA